MCKDHDSQFPNPQSIWSIKEYTYQHASLGTSALPHTHTPIPSPMASYSYDPNGAPAYTQYPGRRGSSHSSTSANYPVPKQTTTNTPNYQPPPHHNHQQAVALHRQSDASAGVSQGVLVVHVSAAALPKHRKSTVYAKMVIAGKKIKTQPSKGGTFNEGFRFVVSPTLKGQYLFVEVKMKRTLGSALVLGTGKIKVREDAAPARNGACPNNSPSHPTNRLPTCRAPTPR